MADEAPNEDPRARHPLVRPTKEDEATLAKASASAVLPTWAKSCKNVEPNCIKIWNETVGKARGLTIK